MSVTVPKDNIVYIPFRGTLRDRFLLVDNELLHQSYQDGPNKETVIPLWYF